MVGNDYTIRFQNVIYQLLKPIYPGQKKGKVTVNSVWMVRWRSAFANTT